MRRMFINAAAMLVLNGFSLHDPCRFEAQAYSLQTSTEDTAAIEAIVHSDPSDHVTEDVSFTNIFGTVRYGRAEFVKRHIETAQTIFKGTTPKVP